jgi:hypothetical protein
MAELSAPLIILLILLTYICTAFRICLNFILKLFLNELNVHLISSLYKKSEIKIKQFLNLFIITLQFNLFMKAQFTVLRVACSALLLFGTTMMLNATDIYLSPTGSDSADGLTTATAVKTCSRAITQAVDGDVIHVTGMINMMDEPNNPAVTGYGAIDVNGGSEYTVGGVTYNTWIIRAGGKTNGTGGVRFLNKSITFIGDDRKTCGFDGAEQTRIFRIDGAQKTTLFKNLIFKNGNNDADGDQGGALYIRNCWPSFESCDFIDNFSLTVSGTVCRGAAVFFNSTKVDYVSVFKDCAFKGNYAREGTFFVQSGSLDVLNCLFEENGNTLEYYFRGGAFYIHPDGTNPIQLNVKNSIFRNNSVAFEGGVVYYKENVPVSPSNTYTFESCAFISNGANFTEESRGGVVSIDNSMTGNYVNMSFINSTFYQNSAKYGGAIYIHRGVAGSQLNIVNCTITENTASLEGAGIRLHETDTEAPGGEFSSKNVTTRIYNSIVEGNYLSSGNAADISVRSYTPGDELIIENSFVGMTNWGDDSRYEAKNEFRYDADKENPVSKANFAQPTSYFIDEYNCIPLNYDEAFGVSEGIGYGDAKFLQALNIATDQLGKRRAFVDNKCNIGSVEVDENNMEPDPDDPSGIKTATTESRKIYVSEGSLVIDGQGTGADALNIRIYNTSGILIRTIATSISGDKKIISIPSLAKGLYIINVVIGDDVQVVKVIL